ncbi:MAG: hypothetical protein CM1200mP6_10340 [Anaerolineaceae bacterium]|nr:MAG: hypothetical protein CM1200mP6_10340 [Anaerolineaceae bacterium]
MKLFIGAQLQVRLAHSFGCSWAMPDRVELIVLYLVVSSSYHWLKQLSLFWHTGSSAQDLQSGHSFLDTLSAF